MEIYISYLFETGLMRHFFGCLFLVTILGTRFNTILATVVVIAFGILVELLQGASVINGTASFTDFNADLYGALLGCAVLSLAQFLKGGLK